MVEDKERPDNYNNNQIISELVSNFRECVEITSDFSKNVEGLTILNDNLKNNAKALKAIDKNFNNSDKLKEIISLTDNIKYITVNYEANIPKLIKSIETLIKELGPYIDQLANLEIYLKNVPKEIRQTTERIKLMIEEYSKNNENMLTKFRASIEAEDKKINNANKQTSDNIIEELTNVLNRSFNEYKNNILIEINKTLDAKLKNIQKLVPNENNKPNNQIDENVKAANINCDLIAEDTIYNLYTSNKEILPIYVRKASWSSNFYLKVDKITSETVNETIYLYASGNRYLEAKFYDRIKTSAEEKKYIIYHYKNS